MRVDWRGRVVIAAATMLAALSCESKQPEGEVGQVSRAVCSASDLYQDPGVTTLEQRTCTGPWRYHLYQSACTLTCTRPRECSHACFGVATTEPRVVGRFGEGGTCSCPEPGCENPPIVTAEQLASQRLDDMIPSTTFIAFISTG